VGRKLFRVDVRSVVFVLAHDENDAEGVALGAVQWDMDRDEFECDVSAATLIDAVPAEFRDSAPYGSDAEGDGEMSIAEFIASGGEEED